MYYLKELIYHPDLFEQKQKSEGLLRKLNKFKLKDEFYLICIASGNTDNLDIYEAAQLLKKNFPKDDLYVLGIAKEKEQAEELSVQIHMALAQKYQTYNYKQALLKDKEYLFRRM